MDAGARGDRGSRRHGCLLLAVCQYLPIYVEHLCLPRRYLDISNDQQKARDYLALPSTQLISQMNSTTAPGVLLRPSASATAVLRKNGTTENQWLCFVPRSSFLATFAEYLHVASRDPVGSKTRERQGLSASAWIVAELARG